MGASSSPFGRARWGGLAVVLLLVFAPISAARADFAAGLAAFKAGDYAGALAEWGPAARAGEAAAQYGIGLMFANGFGFARNATEAVRWFQKAAAQGEARAQYRLGMAYLEGEGVAPDRGLAERWLRAAAEKGLDEAKAALARLADGGKASSGKASSAKGADGKGYAVHLASFRTREAAQREWKRLGAAYGKLLGGLDARFPRVDLGAEKGVYYRLLAGPLADAKRARALCKALRKHKVECRVVPAG